MIEDLRFRWRIAIIFSVATALLAVFVFVGIYLTTRTSAIRAANAELVEESGHLLRTMVVVDGKLSFATEDEWNESEHTHIEVNPTFLQVVDPKGRMIRCSVNMNNRGLIFYPAAAERIFYNMTYSGKMIRVMQEPVKDNSGKVCAFMLVAMPIGESLLILKHLQQTLLLLFPIVVLLLFGLTYYVAGRSIEPVNDLIKTANRINSENLGERIALPQNRDEIYELSETLNALFARIESSLMREQQFTADVSHELRTPIATIRGQLEVLLRKPRTEEEYRLKINDCVTETDRLSMVISQLLLLARCESGQVGTDVISIEPLVFLRPIADRLKPVAIQRGIAVELKSTKNELFYTDIALAEIIVQNLVENAIKYASQGSKVTLSARKEDGKVWLEVHNFGKHIPAEELEQIFYRFYRSSSSAVAIRGSGLGLAIVQRIANLINVELRVTSEEKEGTRFSVGFPAV